MKLKWKNFDFDLSSKTLIMGILNATPDSFSEDGIYLEKKRAVDHALEMQEQGADIIDIGGESTRPGAKKVSAGEEIKRVVPVIEELDGKLNIPVSIDTYKSSVAKAAIAAGASMINDISGLRFDPEMPKVAANAGVPVVIMHIKGTPGNMQMDTTYRSLLSEIMDYLRQGIEIARKAGIPEDRIIIDPGIGFGKSVGHNFEILKYLNEFKGFEKPILIGPSRKSFIGKTLGDLPVSERLEGTAAAVAIGIFNGADIIRVHDVKAMARVAKTADSIKKGH